MEKKRVLFVINDLNIGGVEKSLLSLLNSFPHDRYDVDLGVIRLQGGFLPFIPGWVNVFEITSLNSRAEILLKRMRALPTALRNGRLAIAGKMAGYYALSQASGTLLPFYRAMVPVADLPEYDVAVSYQGPSELLDFFVAERVKARKKVAWIHFDVSRFFARTKSINALYPGFDRVCVVSEQAREAFCVRFPDLAGSTRLFPNIVDYELCRRMSLEANPFKDDGRLKVVTVGRLEEAKGPVEALEAARELSERGVEFHWYFIGEGSLAPLLRKRISAYGLEGTVTLTGALTNPYPYMAHCDVYVQPSRHEGFGLTIAEAMGLGAPVVSSDTIGARGQLEDVATATIVKDFTPPAVADAIVSAAGFPRAAVRTVASPSRQLLDDIF